MDKWMEISLIIALALSIACIVMLSGCTASDGSQSGAVPQGGFGPQNGSLEQPPNDGEGAPPEGMGQPPE